MASRTILVADDEPKAIEIIRPRLERDGFRVLVAADGAAAPAPARTMQPDLIVLDLMLPQIDGLDVCHILRAEDESTVPIIMLTARATEDDTLLGLASGADDYLTKPFSPRELSARITAADPSGSARPACFSCGDLAVDLRRHAAWRRGAPLRLTPTEFAVLAVLIAEPQRAFIRPQLLHRVFGHTYDGAERGVDVHVTNLRKKLEPDPARPTYIETVYGVGYRFAGGGVGDGDPA